MGGRVARATVCGLLSAGLVAACTTHDTVRPVALPKLAPLPVGPASVVDVEPQAELAPPAVDVAEPDVEPAPPVRLAPGVYPHEVNIEGQVRRWTTVVPPDGGGIDPAGLVVVLHGVGGRGIDIRSTTGLEQPARGRGVVFAYPDAIGGAWNDGRPGADPMQPNVTVDDVHFLRLMIDATLTRTGVAPRKVAVVGFSNGAVMAA